MPSHGLYDHGLFCASATHRDFTRGTATLAMPYLQQQCAVHLSWGWLRAAANSRCSVAGGPVRPQPIPLEDPPPSPPSTSGEPASSSIKQQALWNHYPTRWPDSHPPRWTGALQKGVIRTRWPDELEVSPTNRFAHAATGRAVLYCMSSIGARIYVRVADLVSGHEVSRSAQRIRLPWL